MKINLQEKYLHNVVISSINKLIKEDVENIAENGVDYLDDIINGVIDEMQDTQDGITEVLVIGQSDKMYFIDCVAQEDEVSPYVPAKWTSYDDYQPDQQAQYEHFIDVKKVVYFDEEINEEMDITNSIDIETLNNWLEDNLDWEKLADNRYSAQNNEQNMEEYGM